MSKIMQAALDPSCLLCYTPQGWYSPLRQGVVWPGPPRNFATEPAIWYDFYSAVAGFSGDWRFKFDFSATANTTVGSVWHVPGYVNAFNIYCVNSNNYVITLCKDGNSANNVSFVFRPLDHGGYGKHEITGIKVGDTVTVYANGVPLGSSQGFGIFYLSTRPESNIDSTFYKISFTDLNTGKLIWSYPSISERLRLITGTNILSTSTHWEAANTLVAARIDTAIDLRGIVSDYTVLVDFEAADLLSGSKQELVGQGASVSSYPSICSLSYLYYSGYYQIVLSHEISGSRQRAAVILQSRLSGRHVVTGRVEVGINTTTLSVYLDGEFLYSESYIGIPTGYTDAQNFAIGDNRSGNLSNTFGKIYAAAIFNNALTAEQIAYLSN